MDLIDEILSGIPAVKGAWHLVRGEKVAKSLGVHPLLLAGEARTADAEDEHHVMDAAREKFVTQAVQVMGNAAATHSEGLVMYRTSDYSSATFRSLKGSREVEPTLEDGRIARFRGFGRFLLERLRPVLRWELEACQLAILRGVVGTLALTFPFIRAAGELKVAFRELDDVGLQPDALGMTAEVPTMKVSSGEALHLLTSWSGAETKVVLLDLDQVALSAHGNQEHPYEIERDHLDGVLFNSGAYVADHVRVVRAEADKAGAHVGLGLEGFSSLLKSDQETALAILTLSSFMFRESPPEVYSP